MDEDFESYANRVRSGHQAHWLAVLTAAVWTGTIYGWLAGVAALMGLVVVISLTNAIILAKTGSLRAVRFSRWAWVLAALLAIIISLVEVQSG